MIFLTTTFEAIKAIKEKEAQAPVLWQQRLDAAYNELQTPEVVEFANSLQQLKAASEKFLDVKIERADSSDEPHLIVTFGSRRDIRSYESDVWTCMKDMKKRKVLAVQFFKGNMDFVDFSKELPEFSSRQETSRERLTSLLGGFLTRLYKPDSLESLQRKLGLT